MTRREEIEQQASLTVFPWDDVREQSKFEEGFIEGAKWADKTMIDKACEWLKLNAEDYVATCYDKGELDSEGLLMDFRKAMEE